MAMPPDNNARKWEALFKSSFSDLLIDQGYCDALRMKDRMP